VKLRGRKRRHQRIRKKVIGSAMKPRLCVFRSNQHIYAQLVDDTQGKVVLGISSVNKGGLKSKKKIEVANEVGKEIGRLALEKGIKEVAFDRGGYKYHGRVRALAEGAREAGLKF
jgi:large subunit ribosomal protein L18